MLGGQEPPGMQPRVVILWLASRCRARVATPFRSCPRSDIRVASYRDHVPTGSQARGHAEAGTPRHRGRGGPRRAQVLASPALLQRPLGFGPLSAPVPPAPVCPAGSVPSEHRPPAARLCPVSGARNAACARTDMHTCSTRTPTHRHDHGHACGSGMCLKIRPSVARQSTVYVASPL